MSKYYFGKVVGFKKGNPASVFCSLGMAADPGKEKGKAELKLYFYQGGIVRVKYGDLKAKRLIENMLVDEKELAARLEKKLKFSANKARISIKSGAHTVNIDKKSLKIIISDKNSVIFAQNSNDVKCNKLFASAPAGLSPVRENLELGSTEMIFGLGEKFMPLNKAGRKVVSWADDPGWTSSTDISYKNIPFFMSSKGYGIFINSSNKITYDLGLTSSISLSFEAESNVMDYFILPGAAYTDIIRKYHSLTGKPVLPPKWSFGLWLSRACFMNKKELMKSVNQMRAKSIPFDVAHLDPFWMEGRGAILEDTFLDLKWDEKTWPDYMGMADELHRRGIKLSLWINPYVHNKTASYKVLLKNKWMPTVTSWGKDYKPGPEELIGPAKFEIKRYAPNYTADFTNPEFVSWYKAKLRRLLNCGADAFKSDYGEQAAFTNAKYHNGMQGAEAHNLFPLLYNKAVFEAVKESGKCGLIWGRSGYAGIQKYPVQWSGDTRAKYDVMAAVLRAGLSYGLSGVPFWSHDIGSFADRPSPEMFVRWAQFGLFCSHSRVHGFTPREPWTFGRRAGEIFKSYDDLRYELMPYIYSTAKDCVRTGEPFLRALCLDWQSDPSASAVDTQYLFGRNIMVAPIMNETGKRKVYLPAGTWLDFWTKKIIKGQTTLDVEAPLDIMPMFLRVDTITPWGELRQHTVDAKEKKLTLDVFVENKAEFLYEDDFEKVELSAAVNKSNMTIKIDGEGKKEYSINIFGWQKSKRISAGKGVKLVVRRLKHCLNLSFNCPTGKVAIVITR